MGLRFRELEPGGERQQRLGLLLELIQHRLRRAGGCRSGRPGVEQARGLGAVGRERGLDLAEEFALMRGGDRGLARANPMGEPLALVLEGHLVGGLAVEIETEHRLVELTDRRFKVFGEMKGVLVHGGDAAMELAQFTPRGASGPRHDEGEEDGGQSENERASAVVHRVINQRSAVSRRWSRPDARTVPATCPRPCGGAGAVGSSGWHASRSAVG
ncbi:MAG: hypothetical protein M5U12_03375 [Verrucomicrobia bacterium]|nr:hypothetical protein [Verrucomicrobiota bacterium]